MVPTRKMGGIIKAKDLSCAEFELKMKAMGTSQSWLI